MDIISQVSSFVLLIGEMICFIFQFQVAAYILTSVFQGPHSVDFYMCPNACIVSFWLVEGWLTEGTVVQSALFAQLQAHAAIWSPAHCDVQVPRERWENSVVQQLKLFTFYKLFCIQQQIKFYLNISDINLVKRQTVQVQTKIVILRHGVRLWFNLWLVWSTGVDISQALMM